MYDVNISRHDIQSQSQSQPRYQIVKGTEPALVLKG